MTTEPTHETRKLSPEELYDSIRKDYRRLLVKLGQMESEIFELRDIRDKLQVQLDALKKQKSTDVISDQLKQSHQQNAHLKRQNTRLRNSLGVFISKLQKYEKVEITNDQD